MLKLIALILLLSKSYTPAPEILAEPVPLMRESTINIFVAPLWDKGPGHRGIDLPVLENLHLIAPFSGKVHFVGQVVNREVITLVSETGLKASFEPVCSDLLQGQRVSPGEQIGIRCQGNETYSPHCISCVHFSIRNEYGYLNPLLFYGGVNAPRLLG